MLAISVQIPLMLRMNTRRPKAKKARQAISIQNEGGEGGKQNKTHTSVSVNLWSNLSKHTPKKSMSKNHENTAASNAILSLAIVAVCVRDIINRAGCVAEVYATSQPIFFRSSLVKSKPIWLHPQVLNLAAKKVLVSHIKKILIEPSCKACKWNSVSRPTCAFT